MKTLIVYFSRSGYTRRIAEQIAAALKADSTPIADATSRQGFFGYLRSGFESATRRAITGVTPYRDLRAYDLVVLGTPIWNWNLSSPVRTYAMRCGEQMRKADSPMPQFAFFCTMGGSGAERAFSELQQLLGRAPLARLALTDAELDRGAYQSKLQTFIATLAKAEAVHSATV